MCIPNSLLVNWASRMSTRRATAWRSLIVYTPNLRRQATVPDNITRCPWRSSCSIARGGRVKEYPRNTGQLGVGHVLCGTEFSHEFKHPSEDRPTWDFEPKACEFSTHFVKTASRAFDNLPSEPDFAKAASIVIPRRWPA